MLLFCFPAPALSGSGNEGLQVFLNSQRSLPLLFLPPHYITTHRFVKSHRLRIALAFSAMAFAKASCASGIRCRESISDAFATWDESQNSHPAAFASASYRAASCLDFPAAVPSNRSAKAELSIPSPTCGGATSRTCGLYPCFSARNSSVFCNTLPMAFAMDSGVAWNCVFRSLLPIQTDATVFPRLVHGRHGSRPAIAPFFDDPVGIA